MTQTRRSFIRTLGLGIASAIIAPVALPLLPAPAPPDVITVEAIKRAYYLMTPRQNGKVRLTAQTVEYFYELPPAYRQHGPFISLQHCIDDMPTIFSEQEPSA